MGDIYGYIYKITNIVNGKIYIGQTIRSIEERFKEHCKPHNNENAKVMPISRAIKKYGKDNFIIEVVDTAVGRNELNKKEEDYILSCNSVNKKIGYNVSSGGGNGNNFAGKTDEEFDKIRGKISESLKKYWANLSEKDKIKLIDDFKERTRYYTLNITSEKRHEINKKVSIALTGRKMTDEQKKNMSIIRTGIKFSDEAILKNALNKKHRFVNQDIKKSKKQKFPKQPLKSDSKTGEKNPMYGFRGEKNSKSINIKCINLVSGEETIICGIQNAGRQLMIPATKICRVLKGKCRTTCGYKFEYAGGNQC